MITIKYKRKRRPSGTYYVLVIKNGADEDERAFKDQRGHRITNDADADAEILRLRADIAAGKNPFAAEKPFIDWIGEFKTFVSKHRKGRTAEVYEDYLKPFEEWFFAKHPKTIRPADITGPMMVDYQTHRLTAKKKTWTPPRIVEGPDGKKLKIKGEMKESGAKLSEWTLRKDRQVLVSLFEFIIERTEGRGLKENPAKKMPFRKVPKRTKRNRAVPEDPIWKMADCLLEHFEAGATYEKVWRFGIESLARPDELFSLTVKQFDRDFTGVTFYGSKDEEDRWVPISESMAEELAAHCDGKQSDDLVFVTSKGTSIEWGYTIAIQRAAKRLKLKGVSPYSTRHTGITRLVDKGYPSKYVAELAGHNDTRMIDEFYAHTSEKLKREAVNDVALTRPGTNRGDKKSRPRLSLVK